MKTTNLIKAILAVGVATSLWSCSKGNSDTATASTSTVSTYDGGAGTGYNASNWPDDGATAVFTPVSKSTMSNWVALHALNSPKNYRVRVQLQRVYKSDGSGPYYYGYVSLGYTDTGVWYESYLSIDSATNVSCSNCNDNGALEAKHNYFYKQSDGTIVFSGFFQDLYGAIVLTLKPESGTGTSSTTTYSGSVFYKNFSTSTKAQTANRKCWFITSGAYTCTSSTVESKTSITSISNYTKLGTFSGLSKSAVLLN